MLHRDERRNGTSKRVRETEAEAVSFVVCSAIGLATGTAAQDYIQLYEGDAKLITESLDRIQQTANRILTAITPEQPASPA
jgi:DNA transposition AAA+ family ATPase